MMVAQALQIPSNLQDQNQSLTPEQSSRKTDAQVRIAPQAKATTDVSGLFDLQRSVIATPQIEEALSLNLAPEDPSRMADELAQLDPSQVLFTNSEIMLVASTQRQLPSVINEIGRLRELSFRAVGEGTGRMRDLDQYDEWYTHLFAWDATHRQVLGAYRLALTEQVIAQHGMAGLYTSTLFGFSPSFFGELGPAVELGRSFVRPECQRSSRVLALLWRGIGAIISREPRYTLFGPVSVSAQYTDASRRLIAHSLLRGAHLHPLAAHVTALHPVPPPDLVDDDLSGDLDERELNRRVKELEPDRHGLPTLLREYLKLGGRFMSFSVDPNFANAMDGLVAVDLRVTNPKLLALYMGPEAYTRFKAAA